MSFLKHSQTFYQFGLTAAAMQHIICAQNKMPELLKGCNFNKSIRAFSLFSS